MTGSTGGTSRRLSAALSRLTWRAVAGLLALVLAAPAAAGTIGFEGLIDGDAVGSQYSGLGVTFSNATVLTAGLSLNEFEFPPHGGANVAFDDGGPIVITFASPVSSVMAYFTYGLDPAARLVFSAFDRFGALLGTVLSSFSNNEALSGDAGSSPNELLSLTFAQGIAMVVVTGAQAGGSFVLDDLAIARGGGSVPEPATLALVALGIVVLRTRRQLAA